MAGDTILWHDYETSGRDARRDRPLQFAAIRTDADLEEIEAPLEWRCALPAEVLPDPEACLVTGVVPGDHAADELGELDFARRVLEELERPGTCTAGYNSIRFDDEFTRFLLWRNLLPVYDREWRNGNTRFDLLDPLRAAYALRPEGIEWPLREDGAPSFRLEHLTAANGIEHGAAHDAVADVRATIAMARRLRDAQPRLWADCLRARFKQHVRDRLKVGSGEAVVHVSGKIAASLACATVLVPVTVDATAKNQVLCVDLRRDPAELLERDRDDLRASLYAPRSARGDDHRPVGVKTVHLNRAPVVAPLAVLDDPAWERLQLDPAAVAERQQLVAAHRDALADVVADLHARPAPGAEPDPEEALYDGFVDDADARRARLWHTADAAQRAELERQFVDERLRTLAFRLRAREAPESLTDAETAQWQDFVRGRLLAGEPSRAASVRARIEALAEEAERTEDQRELLKRLSALVDARVAAAH